MNDDESTTVLALYRRDNQASFCIASLEWMNKPQVKSGRIEHNDGWFQRCSWYEGTLRLIIKDFLVKKDAKIHQIIASLQQFPDIPIIGYPNSVLESKLNNYQPLQIIEKDSEFLAIERQEINDLIEDLRANNRLINKVGKSIESPMANMVLSIIIRVFKKDLITTKHHYQESPEVFRTHDPNSVHNRIIRNYLKRWIKQP